VGLDGAPNTGDIGEGDGKPTSGVGTAFPGEPNIDKTDVSEADQIGLTNVQYLAAGAINFSQTADITFWAEFMIPGSFVDPSLIGTGEYDLFVSSGLFPLNAGQIERISFAVVMGNAVRCPGNADFTGAKDDALKKRRYAQQAYNEDYQFAQAPLEPTVYSVGTTNANGRPQVTLYWDEASEQSVDRFLAGVTGGSGRDFEGYRIYRSTDPAFLDAQKITDAYGNPAPWLKPIAQFDLVDEFFGDSAAAPFNGISFYMGDNNGIQHTWTDTSVQAGQKYYYAVRAYDQGYRPFTISPAESNLKISIDPVTGKVKDFGKSVVIVVPEAPVAGYLPPNVSAIKPISGTATGSIGYKVVDPTKVQDNATYRITFDDTVHAGRAGDPDTVKTKWYTLVNLKDQTRPDTVLAKRRPTPTGLDLPVVQGVQLVFNNDRRYGLDTSRSRYSRSNMWKVELRGWREGSVVGKQYPNDYRIVFGSMGIDTSTAYDLDGGGFIVPAIPVNFKVLKASENNARMKFAFFEKDDVGGVGKFSGQIDPAFRDYILILEPNERDTLKLSWSVIADFDSVRTIYVAGDTISLVTYKSFGKRDAFEFTTTAQRVDQKLAATSLNKIKVVPNPYVGAASWEERNPFPTGRGPRAIHFTHLPQRCTIRIYSISGELISTIEHDSQLLDGTAEWNVLTKDALQVAYGVYIYHVEAPGVGEKVGKFAIIK
jgi:hypothetical protein